MEKVTTLDPQAPATQNRNVGGLLNQESVLEGQYQFTWGKGTHIELDHLLLNTDQGNWRVRRIRMGTVER